MWHSTPSCSHRSTRRHASSSAATRRPRQSMFPLFISGGRVAARPRQPGAHQPAVAGSRLRRLVEAERARALRAAARRRQSRRARSLYYSPRTGKYLELAAGPAEPPAAGDGAQGPAPRPAHARCGRRRRPAGRSCARVSRSSSTTAASAGDAHRRPCRERDSEPLYLVSSRMRAARCAREAMPGDGPKADDGCQCAARARAARYARAAAIDDRGIRDRRSRS